MHKKILGTDIAPWFHLHHLPPCSCGFKSQAHHLHFSFYSQILFYICNCVEKRTKKNKKEDFGHFPLV